MDDASAVKLIRNLKLMAEDPNKRPALAGDSTCVGGLVMVLSNQNKDVIQKALETLLLLSECQDQVPFLATFTGMQDQLHAIVDNRPDVDATCRRLAAQLKENLNMKHEPVPEQNQIGDGRKVPRNFFLGGHKSKTIVLQIKGMKDHSDIDTCRDHLIRVRGLVSVTFDLLSRRAIIRARTHVQPESLAEAVAKGGMSAEQVVRGDNGEEVFLRFGASCAAELETSLPALPDYLPDDDSPVKLSSRPMAPSGTVPPSDSWWGKAANFISSSLYW